MGGVSPETCWAIKKQWNNKFYYTVASCWFFLWVWYFPSWMFCTLTAALSEVCALPTVADNCSSLQSYRALPVCCSGIFWMLLWWLQLPILLLVSLLLLHSTCALFLLYLRIFKTLPHLSLSRLSPHFALSINKHVSFSSSRITMSSLLIGMVLSVCTVWLPCFHALFLLIVLHDYTIVPFMILSLFPCIC